MSNIASIDEVMYSCGLEVLHPGGLEKSEEMARACGISSEKNILEVGCGKGATALHLAKKYRCRITGIDYSEDMIKYAQKNVGKKKLTDKVNFIKASAYELPFDNKSFDIILTECTTTLLDREKAFPQFLKFLKPGGYFGNLEFIWKNTPPEEVAEDIHNIWNGFTTLTLTQWEDFYKSLGLKEIKGKDFSEEIPKLGLQMQKELGIPGMARLGAMLFLNHKLGAAMTECSRIFNEYGNDKKYLGCGYIIGKK